MVQATPLHHVNGGDPLALLCTNCGNTLGNDRAAANTPLGPRWSCKQEDGATPTIVASKTGRGASRGATNTSRFEGLPFLVHFQGQRR
jgi:hypothetical protein